MYKGVLDAPVYDRPTLEQDRVVEPFWLWAALGAMVLSLVLRQGALFLAASLLLCAERVSYLWGRFALSDVAYRRHLLQQRAAWGEDVTLRIEIDNRKLLPLPWLRIEDEVPADLPLTARLGPSHQPTRRLLRHILAMLWFQRVSRNYRITCAARGEHLFGPAELYSGDIFGLSTSHLKVPARTPLLVYPRVVPVSGLLLPSIYPFGDARTPQRLFEDPMRTIGIRDYAMGDSLRHVHWKATAHTGRPQVRIFEPVRTVRALIFLDIVTDRPDNPWVSHRYDPELLELVIVAAASVSMHLLAEGFEVGLHTNGRALRHEGLVGVPPGATPDVAAAILESLAVLGPIAAAPLNRVISYEGRRLPPHTTVVVISAAAGDSLLESIIRLHADGHSVTLIYIGEQGAVPAIPGVIVQCVPADCDWRTMSALPVEG